MLLFSSLEIPENWNWKFSSLNKITEYFLLRFMRFEKKARVKLTFYAL